MIIDSHTKSLIEAGELRKAAEWLHARAELSQNDRILRAELELQLGDIQVALESTEAILREHLETSARAYCLGIAGRALGRMGNVPAGTAKLRNAIELVAARNPALAAQLLAELVGALISWVGIEPALTELPRLRRVSLASGNLRALVQFHIAQGRIYAMRGWLSRAENEGRFAADLLIASPDLVLSTRIKQLQSNISIKTPDMESARVRAEECLTLAKRCGARIGIGAALGNLAHIAAVTGKFDEARPLIADALEALPQRNTLRASVFATGVEIALATNDADFAASMIGDCRALLDTHAQQYAYNELFFELQRVRWLVHCAQYMDAFASATEALRAIHGLADPSLLDRMRLLQVEAQWLNGDSDEALKLFRNACFSITDTSVETLAELNRVAAVLTAPTGQYAHDYLSRAWNALTEVGLFGSRVAITQTARRLGISDTFTSGPFAKDSSATIHTVAAALDWGGHPPLLALEIKRLLELTPANAAVAGQASATPHPLEVGPFRGSQVVVEAMLQPGAEQTMLWRSIDQVSRGARAIADQRLSIEEQISLWPEESWPDQLGMVVASEEMVGLVNTARRLAPSTIPVLITGETGTGKELLAKVLHDASHRKDKQFIPFNCSSVGKDLLDAQLFGYRRGAFTGANEAFQGIVRAAAGGTLFLDEIGEVSLEAQPKLLRFLESGDIHPLGEAKPIHVDVRVVAATNADLEQMVAEGRFREDLLYRLNVVRLQVPPLRKRREEIPPLTQHFLERASRESHKTGMRLADTTMEYLILYSWPGNVRQLANEIRRMVALAESGAVLMPEHLSNEIASSRRTIPVSDRFLAPTEFVVRMDQPMSAAMEHLERSMIQYALKLTQHRMEDAAQLLGLSRKGLYLKRQRLGIDETSNTTDGSEASDPAPPDAPLAPATRSSSG
ncbi:MAG TPA: sigma-54 dependent transcriptional regulator [Vicinamibacterales bacterium]|nr:sigma-54 dependent transcriptional regulator [Vicinamibacterales bacterium]